MEVPAYIEIEHLADGSLAFTVKHNKHRGVWAKFKIGPTSTPLITRAIKSVYKQGAADADAYFHANGMSDEEAFNKQTWRTRY